MAEEEIREIEGGKVKQGKEGKEAEHWSSQLAQDPQPLWEQVVVGGGSNSPGEHPYF